MAGIYARSATRIVTKSVSDKILWIKRREMENVKQENKKLFMYFLIHTPELLELLPYMNSKKQEFKGYFVESHK